MIRFKSELKAAGFMGEPDDFTRRVYAMFRKDYPMQSYEKFVREPEDALRFCVKVREEFGLVCLSNSLILGTLENGRKRSLIPA